MRALSVSILSLFIISIVIAQDLKVSSGKVVRHELFNSKFVDKRNIDVWLPDDYTLNKKYAVIYIHDGQMLFDASLTWNKQEWGVDEVMASLMRNKRIRNCIVVGIWNNKQKRHAEYFPQRSWKLISRAEQQNILQMESVHINPKTFEKEMLADAYLKFIVRELKPYIDQHYSTKTDKANTFMMGSSMGALISIYALCEYPGIFGGSICLSTHWPAINGITLYFLEDNLPKPQTHKIYFDYGTATLDSLYEPYQLKVDSIMHMHGFQKNISFLSKKFEGAEHSESSWRRRLHIPLEWMLKE